MAAAFIEYSASELCWIKILFYEDQQEIKNLSIVFVT